VTRYQWIVFGMLCGLLVIELVAQPTTRGYFVRLFHTLMPDSVLANNAAIVASQPNG
jgi:hypothetical protein